MAIRTARQAMSGLAWITDHIGLFAPASVLDDESACKPLLELVVLMVFWSRAASPSAPTSAIMSQLVEVARRSELREKPISTPNHLVLRAALHALTPAFADNALRSQGRAVQRAVDTGLIGQSERLPHHVMTERVIFDWAGLRHDLPTMADIRATSLLARRPNALYLNERGSYELTHDIMFGYAFGERADEVTPAAREDLRRVLSDSLIRFVGEGHWDLVGELLISWDTLGCHHDGIYDTAWAAFAAMQDGDGSLPGVQRPGETDQKSATRSARFRQRYHTTLVMVFAATLRIQRQQGADPPSPALTQKDAGAAPSKDVEWLKRLIVGQDAPVSTTAAARALVSSFLLRELEPATPRAQLAELDGIVRTALEGARGPAAWTQVPATLTLLTFGVLRGEGVEIPALTAFVEGIRAVVARDNADGRTTSWSEQQILLARLGMASPPARPPLDDLWRALDRGDPASSQLAGACSAYGVDRHRPLEEIHEVGVRRLEALGVDALRRRDIVTGCALLRSAHALRPLTRERLRSVTAFLRAEQRPDGGCFRLDPAIVAEWHQVKDAQLDLDRDVRLPVSLAVWWALVEFSSDFRLFRFGRAGDEKVLTRL